MTARPDFSKIWASESPLTPYSFADADYLKGWAMVGDIPPDRRMFDALQRLNDEKLKWVSENAALNLRKPSTEYADGDIAYSALLPSWAYLECTVGGTTDSGNLPVPSSVSANDTFTDGTVEWTVKKVGDSDLTEYTKTVNSPMFNKRDVITTSGTYTAPVNGWYKITVKGGGGGGGYGGTDGVQNYGNGSGGGEGGTTIAFEHMSAGDTATVVIGAGGSKGTSISSQATAGGNSTVTVNGNVYIGGGGGGGNEHLAGLGGSGTIPGCTGGAPITCYLGRFTTGGTGGGTGGAQGAFQGIADASIPIANSGGGGGGGYYTGTSTASDGADGFVSFEYFDFSLNP